MQNGLNSPGPFTIFLVFSAGLLTSLGPCSLSLLPVTIAYIGGTEKNKFKLISFSGGVVFSLVALGAASGFLGKIYGQIPSYYTSFVALIAIIMGLNLLGILKFQFPNGPDLKIIEDKIPSFLAPFAIGSAFGLASSPCITPVLATLLAWDTQARRVAKTGVMQGEEASPNVVPMAKGAINVGILSSIIFISGPFGN